MGEITIWDHINGAKVMKKKHISTIYPKLSTIHKSIKVNSFDKTQVSFADTGLNVLSIKCLLLLLQNLNILF